MARSLSTPALASTRPSTGMTPQGHHGRRRGAGAGAGAGGSRTRPSTRGPDDAYVGGAPAFNRPSTVAGRQPLSGYGRTQAGGLARTGGLAIAGEQHGTEIERAMTPVGGRRGSRGRTSAVYVMPFTAGSCIGGSPNRIAPEVLGSLTHTGVLLDFGGQAMWELGIVMYELCLGHHPLPRYAVGHHASAGIVYSVESLPRLPPDTYPPGFAELLKSAAHPQPSKRPTLSDFLAQLKHIMATAPPPKPKPKPKPKVKKAPPKPKTPEPVAEPDPEPEPEPAAPPTPEPRTPPPAPPTPEPSPPKAPPPPWRYSMQAHHGGVSCLLLLDGHTALSGGHDGTVAKWSLGDDGGTQTAVMRGHEGAVCSLARVSRATVASAASDADVRLWDVASGVCVATLSGHTSMVNCLQMAGPYLVSASVDHSVRVWTVPTSPVDEGSSGSADASASVRSAGAGAAAGAATPTEPPAPGSLQSACACRAVLDEHRDWVQCVLPVGVPTWGVVSGSADNLLLLWDLSSAAASSRSVATLEGHANAVHCVTALGPEHVVSGSGDETLKVWNVTEAACCVTLWGHHDGVTAVATISDTRVVSGSDDNEVRIWDVDMSFPSDTLACTWTLKGHVDSIREVVVPQAAALVSTGRDGAVRLWNLAAPDERVALACVWRDAEPSAPGAERPSGDDGGDGLEPFPACVACGRGGDVLVTGSSDGRVKVWPSVAATIATVAADVVPARASAGGTLAAKAAKAVASGASAVATPATEVGAVSAP